ncbi:uncharacterized protein [Diabrotica undecimpunctata]|uniref:uncharacterized protein n=1 Tax=Diabrotica undecimpunctata TaxID=50387 RepID=UPI003B639BE4
MKWCNKSRVTINPFKTQAILFKSPYCQDVRGRISLLGEDLIFRTSVLYLGVRFTRTLNWKADVQETLDSMRQRFNLLKVLSGKLGGTSSKTLLHTYKTFVRPIVEYKACIHTSLNARQLNAITATERRILRYCMRKDWSYPSAHIYAISQITPIKDRILTLSRKYVLRTIAGSNNRAKRILKTPCNHRGQILTKQNFSTTLDTNFLMSILKY